MAYDDEKITNLGALQLLASKVKNLFAEKSDVQVLETRVDNIGTVLTPAGSKAFSELPDPTLSNFKYVYNITDDFTTDARFVEGAGKEYSAGTNVYCIKDGDTYKYDVLGSAVDLTPYLRKDELADSTGQATDIAMSQKASTDNFVNKTGDTMTGNLTIDSSNFAELAPSLTLVTDDSNPGHILFIGFEKTSNTAALTFIVNSVEGLVDKSFAIFVDGSIALCVDGKIISGVADPIEPHHAANKAYVDAHSGSAYTTTDTLPASGTALTANTIYNIPASSPVATYQFVAPATGHIHGRFTTGTPAITFGTGAKFINGAPSFEASTEYEFDVLDNVWVFAKVV